MKDRLIGTTQKAECVDLSFEGKGVAKLDDGRVVFIEGMLPGEKGDVTVAYKRAGELFGSIKKLDRLSPDRIEPRCKVATACGGCVFQHFSYAGQLLFKQKKVKDAFKRIAKLDVNVPPTIGMDEPYYYRNKVQPVFGEDDRRRIYSGFYKAGTHVIVPIEECCIEDKRATEILKKARALMAKFKIRPYDGHENGVVRHILIRTSYHRKEVMAVLITSVDSFPGRGEFVKALLKECPEITTVVQNINRRDTSVVLGERTKVLFGKGYIRDSLCGVEFRISAKSFYQTNPEMTEKLYQKAIEFAGLMGEETVFDAYSGIGTIGLIASKKAKRVISVEIVGAAVRDAIHNAHVNGITNFEAYQDDASLFINRMVKAGKKIDVLFMDPPRKGSDERFLKAVMGLSPRKVIYVSCEPTTLARDVAYLKDSYQIESVQPFDMFPQTFHVETVVGLRLKSANK
jgi:23S rRNA (uracil1939-C5)-methyltransferase